MSRVQIAFYKGPAGSFWQKLGHYVTCFWTQSQYSHCELVVDGVCYSASARDGGVRRKEIDLGTGKWDIVDWPDDYDAQDILNFFDWTKYKRYDWVGLLRFVFPFIPSAKSRWYCSEWCAAALGFGPIFVSPQQLYELVNVAGAFD